METKQEIDSVDTLDQVSDNQEKNHVSIESHRRLLGEKKRAAQEARELKEKLAAYEQEKLELEGKKDEALSSWKKKAEAFEAELKQTKQVFAKNAIDSQIKSFAQEQGCVNPDALMKLFGKDVYKSLDVSDNYEVEKESLSRVIEDAKKEFSNLNLFGKKEMKVHDVAGKNKIKPQTTEDLLKNAKTPEDVARLLRSL